MFVHRLLPEAGLTHNLTHTAKKADGDSGADRTKNFIFPEQTGPETAAYQPFPCLQSIGKDEVTSSNLVSSSKNPLKSVDFGGFCFVFGTFWVGWFLRFLFDPHADPL